MTSLSFPDINVWVALVTADHVHRGAALAWWERADGPIGFCRFTQIGLLRLLTTAAAMNGKPLSMIQAWKVYDRLLQDERVSLVPEPPALERPFREYTSGARPSPKVWADAYLLAFARQAAGVFVTFDKAAARWSPDVQLLA